MPSSYTTRLRAELQGTGENSGTWGTRLNTLISEVMEEAIAGVAAVTMPDAEYTLTAQNGVTDEARRAVLSVTGALTATRNLICPTATKLYMVYNATTGSQSIVIKTAAGTGITVPNGKKRLVYCDGTNVVDFVSDLPAGTTLNNGSIYSAGGTDVAVADGGTGASTAGAAATNLGLGTGDSPTFQGASLVNSGSDVTLNLDSGAASNASIVFKGGGAAKFTLKKDGSNNLILEASSTCFTLATSGVMNFNTAPTILGNVVYRVGGTDVAIADGGTGASTAADARTNFGIGTGDTVTFTALVLAPASGNILLNSGGLTLNNSAGQTQKIAIQEGGSERWAFTYNAAGTDALVFSNQSIGTIWSGTYASGVLNWTVAPTIGGAAIYTVGGTDVALADGGTGASLADPNADRFFFWDDSAGSTAFLAPNGFNVNIDTTTLYVTETFIIAASDETTALTTGTNKATFVFPYAVTVLSVGCSVNTAGTGLTVDINESGTTILSTKITLDSGEKTSLTAATAPVISDSAIAAGNEVGIDIDSVGGTAKGLKVWMIVRRTS